MQNPHPFSTLLAAARHAALALPLALGAACGAGPDADPDPEPTPCDGIDNCEVVDGAAACIAGFMAEDPAADTLACIPEPQGLPLLGAGSHELGDSLELVVIAQGAGDQLARPRDLDFNPNAPNELWVTNQADNSITVIIAPGNALQSTENFDEFGNVHFLAEPAALAFGGNGNFATIHEEDDLTQGPVEFGGSPEDFMGPTLWRADRNNFDGGHPTHLDMLHNSPNGTGIAWEVDNVYWVFDGWHDALVRYDFNQDHGYGGADHSDGTIARYVEGVVTYEPEVSSNLVLDHDAGWLYAADTGGNRICVLDIHTGQRGNNTYPNYDGVDQYRVDDANLWTVIDGATVDGMDKPSGLELHDGHIWVSDNQSGRIFAFDMEGALVDWLDTGLGAGLQGMAFSPDGELYLVHTDAEQILRLRVLE